MMTYTKAGENMKNGRLAFFNLFSFMCVSALNSQIIPFLTQQGISAYVKAGVLGGSALCAFVLALSFGRMADASGELKRVYLIAVVLYCGTVMLAFSVSWGWLQWISLVFAFGVVKQVMSINETWTFLSEPKKFGYYHCMAAIGLVIGSLISGYLARTSMTAVGIFCAGCGSIAVLISRKLKEKSSKKRKITMRTVTQLMKNREYMVLLGVLFLLMMVGFADQFVVLDKLMELSDERMMITYKFALQSFSEIPFYIALVFLMKKISPMQLLLFASLMSSVKFALYGIASESMHILLISMLQVVTHPIIVVSSKMLIAHVTPSELSNTTQIVGFAVYFGLSGFVTPLLAAWLGPIVGSNALLYMFAGLAAVAFVIGLGMKKSGKYDTVNAE